jgi:uncharacterized protein
MKFRNLITIFHGKPVNIVIMLQRNSLLAQISTGLKRARAVVLVGPRQVGKSTIARHFLSASSSNYFDLEDPRSIERLQDPMTALEKLNGLIVIDEVQRRPDLFPVLRVLMDRGVERGPRYGQFLLLGSASPELLRQSSESLLGRTETIEMCGFNLDEVLAPRNNQQTPDQDSSMEDKLWHLGGFPLSYLADSESNSAIWRSNALNQFVERDLRLLGFEIPPPAMMRFIRMAAHYHGQIWNSSEISRSLGISEGTVRRYIDLLSQSFMLRQLQPWFENIGKRQVKAPKIYFRDSGFFHSLIGVQSFAELLAHPKVGASWEGFALEQVIRLAKPDAAYFWATHQGAELDLLLMRGAQRIGVEFKRVDAPKLTASMKIAMTDLKLNRLYVVYPGLHRYSISNNIEAVPLKALIDPTPSQ